MHLNNVRGRGTTRLGQETMCAMPNASERAPYKKLFKFIQNLCASFSRESIKKSKISFPSKFAFCKVPKVFLQRRLNKNLERQFTLESRVRCPKIKIRMFLEKEAVESSSLKQIHEKKLKKDKQERFDKILMSVQRWDLMQGVRKNC